MEIENDGPAIKSTNYFESLYALQGLCFLSWHDAVAHILIPQTQRDLLPRIVAATRCTISRIVKNEVDSLELSFDDGSDSSLRLVLDMLQTDRVMSDASRSTIVSGWTSQGKVAQCPGEYRIMQ